MRISKFLIFCFCLLPLLLTSACFTGIESTKKITITKDDIKSTLPSAEELFLSDIKSVPDSEWLPGKEFLVIGDRGAMLFEPRTIVSGNYNISEGDTLSFLTKGTVRLPDGTVVKNLRFRRGKDEFSYTPTGKNIGKDVGSDEIPGVIDPDLLKEIGKRLKSMTLWTRIPLWEGQNGTKIDGRKFEKVTITGVGPGTMVFPVRVCFTDEDGQQASMIMNLGNSMKDSRSFANLFYLNDPRKNYSNISDENWESIRRGQVRMGMTKDECRLAKGNPADVQTGHDYQHSLLMWQYSDGSLLYFVDGLLEGINSIPNNY